jgi:HEAT repeat protein
MPSSETNDIAVLIAGLYNPEKKQRAMYTQKIAELGNKALPVLIPLLQDHDWRVRYRVAEALSMIQSDDSVPDLIQTCHDEKDHVRYMAAKALWALKSNDALDTWIQLLGDEHPYTRGIASDGLAVIHDNRGITPLKTAISLEEIPELKERMIQNLNLLKKTD